MHKFRIANIFEHITSQYYTMHVEMLKGLCFKTTNM